VTFLVFFLDAPALFAVRFEVALFNALLTAVTLLTAARLDFAGSFLFFFVVSPYYHPASLTFGWSATGSDPYRGQPPWPAYDTRRPETLLLDTTT
jgi:hypothetical protein